MHKLNLVAVGSNELTAKEIQQILKDILGNFFTIHTATTDSVKSTISNTIFVCASTQGASLQKYIPSEQLFVWDLHPTTSFFLEIT